jgi:hypothetical protein
MFSDIDPMVITLVVVAVAVVGSIIGVARRGRADRAPDRTALPPGADAALWSVTEVLPDPRNHLAIKDPTSELRLTPSERADAAVAAAASTAPLRPAEVARSAQSLAARRAALAKRSTPAPVAAAAPASPVIEAAPSEIELVQATNIDEPLTIFLDDGADDGRHLTLLPEDVQGARPAAPMPRWGETPARAS